MKGFWLCLIIYTGTFFWFGMWVQKISDQRQLKAWLEDSWDKGCRECAKFEIDECARNDLQGIPDHPTASQ